MATPLGTGPHDAEFNQAARDIEKLAHANISEEVFFGKFLDQLAGALGAQAGAAWVLDSQGVLSMVSQLRLAEVGLGEQTVTDRLHVQRLLDVLQKRQPQTYSPPSSAGETVDRRVLLVVPMQHQNRPLGAVELYLSADSTDAAREQGEQFAEEMVVYASRYLAWRTEAGSPDKCLAFWNRFENTLIGLHRNLNSAEVAAVAVNDGRQLVGCERVSVVTREGGGMAVLAISGQDRVNNRSNLVRSLRHLAGNVIAGGEPLLYTGDLNTIPPALEGPLTDYLRESGSRMVKLIPLKSEVRGQKSEVRSPTFDRSSLTSGRTFGVLVIEQVSESWLTPLMDERSERLAEHLAEALHNARSHEQIFLLSVWRFLGRCLGWFRGRNWLKAAAFLGVFTGCVLAMALVPWTYRVEGTGKLMPVVQQDIFAPWEGEVVEIYVTSGQRVEKDQQLLRLRNEELDAQLLSLRSRFDEKQQLLNALNAEIDEADRRTTRDQAIRLRGRLAQTKVELQGIKERLRNLQEQIDRLTVRAPIAGTVATFQIEQRLMNRPVQRGEVLLEIMDETGDWHLEVELPEHRMGHVLAAQAALGGRSPHPLIASSPHHADLPSTTDEEMRSTGDEGLPVEFVLATIPEKSFSGTLSNMATRTDLSPKQGAVVDLQVAVDRDQIPHRRIGAEVRAKIGCGETSLAYVLFGDLVEFIQRRFW